MSEGMHQHIVSDCKFWDRPAGLLPLKHPTDVVSVEFNCKRLGLAAQRMRGIERPPPPAIYSDGQTLIDSTKEHQGLVRVLQDEFRLAASSMGIFVPLLRSATKNHRYRQ